MFINLYFDGGCWPNPGEKYGSFEVFLDGQLLARAERFGLGHGTNNEAEFEALEAALCETLMVLEHSQIDSDSCQVLVSTDSMIVKNRLVGKNRVHKKPLWAIRSQAMFEKANRCRNLLGRFAHFKVEWESRENNVLRFGH